MNYITPKLTIGHYNSKFQEPLEYNNTKLIQDLRKAGECHHQVRQQLKKFIKPNMKIYDICNFIENSIIANFGQNNLQEGIGFPVGFSINNCVAHDTASPNDQRVLKINDIVKIDYGTHVNGRIIDSAFTHSFNPDFDPLIESTREATWEAIKMIGPDTYVNDISKTIDEIIKSYQLDFNNKIHDIKPVSELGGHNIEQYIIHGGTLILCSPIDNPIINKMRIKSNTCYAIETFASTGLGESKETGDNHLFSLKKNYQPVKFKLDTTNKIFNFIKSKYSTLPFCSRWLYKEFGNKYKIAISELEKLNIINKYPPLCDIKNSYSSQLEHTIYVHEYGKEILSHGSDY